MTDSPLRFRRARVGDLPEIVAMLAAGPGRQTRQGR